MNGAVLVGCVLGVLVIVTEVHGKAGACVDKMVGCHVFSRRGWCKHRAAQMKVRCQKTCGLCGRTSVSPNMYSMATSACVDQSKACYVMKTRGWCKHRKAQMKAQCSKTCGMCKISPSSCEDSRHDCKGLKKIGFCSRRPQKMYQTCRKTCDMCTNPNTNEISESVKPSSGCTDTFGRKRCEYYAHIGMCTKKPKFKKICHDTCVCSFKKPIKTKNCKSTKHGCCWDNKTTKKEANGSDCPVCRDDPRFDVLCKRFGEDCQGSGGLARSVRKHCPKTCNFCCK